MIGNFVNIDSETIGKLISHPKAYQYANSSLIFNTLQRYMEALILDFRGSAEYKETHMQQSISMSPEILGIEDLLKFSPAEFAEKHLTGKSKARFLRRKRLYIFLIPSNDAVTSLLDFPDKISESLSAKEQNGEGQSCPNRRGLLSAYLTYKALWAERIKEIYIFPHGFKQLVERYPFLCEYQGAKIYVEP